MIDSGTGDGRTCIGTGVLPHTAGGNEIGCWEEVREGPIAVAIASETESEVADDVDEIWVTGTLVVIL